MKNARTQGKRMGRLAAAALLILMLLPSVPGNPFAGRAWAEEGTEDALRIRAEQETLIVEGGLGRTGSAVLARFHVRDYHESAPFLKVSDPTNTSLEYYDRAAKGRVEATVELSGFRVEIDRFTADGHDKAYDKFYLLSDGTMSEGQIGGGTVLAGPRYATDFSSRQNYARKAQSSNKGLEVMIVDDGEDLGIKHTNHVYDMNSILSSASDTNAILFSCNGKDYYFNRSAVETNDKMLKAFTDAGMETTGVLNMWAYNGSVERTKLLHPEFDYDERVDTLCMAAPNMVQDDGVELFTAVCEFLAERYLREDAKYGRISNWIIGNEIDTSVVWHNMGQVPLEEFVRQYDRSMRIAYTAVKKYWAHANVMPALTQAWNTTFIELFGQQSEVYEKWHQKGSFTSKDVLTALNALTKAEGDYDWKVGFHPYGIDMREDTFWDRQNVEWTNQGPDSRYLTPLNIEELPRFLSKSEMLYRGEMREFYFTEQGYSSKPDGVESWDTYDWAADYDPETTFGEETLMKQAAMYAFAYYKFKFVGAKANIHHRHFDYGPEQAALGVLFREKGTNRDIFGKKPVWEVMKYIDTERSLEFTQPLLKYIEVWKPKGASAAESWEELIPGNPEIPGYEKFDPAQLADAPLVKEETLREAKGSPNYLRTDFENGETDGWTIADNATSLSVVRVPAYAAEGERLAILRYSGDKWTGGGLGHKGIQKVFDEPTDLSEIDSFRFAVQVTKLSGGGDFRHFIKVRFYSGDNVYESTAEVEPGRYYRFAVPLKGSGWSGLGTVDKVKIWYNIDSNDVSASAIYFDDVGFLKGDDEGTGGGCACDGGGEAAVLLLGTLAFAAVAFGMRRF